MNHLAGMLDPLLTGMLDFYFTGLLDQVFDRDDRISVVQVCSVFCFKGMQVEFLTRMLS